MSAQIYQATGLETLSQGPAVFAILPRPHFMTGQIRFAGGGGALRIDADDFIGDLRILPLFVGRLEIANATLLKPRVTVNLDENPMPLDGAIGGAAGAKPDSQEAAANTARLGVISLVDGTARLKMKASGVAIDDIDMTLDWRNLNARASLTGKARIRGESGDFAIWVAQPAELFRGGRSEMTLDIKTGILTLTTDGTLTAASKPRYQGHLQAASPNLPKLLELIGYQISPMSSLNGFRLACDAKADTDGLFFSNLNLSLAGNDFEGSLAVEMRAQKPLLSGTLATEFLNFDPLFMHFKGLISADGQWNQEALDLRALTAADLDIRVSAARAQLTHVEMQDAALSIMTSASGADLSLTQARAYLGLVKAKVTVRLGGIGIDLHATASANDLDIGSLSWDSAGLPELTGIVNGSANIETDGHNLAEFVQNLQGRLIASVKQGGIKGIDLHHFLHPLDGAVPQRVAAASFVRIPFDDARLGIKILHGTAEIEQGLATGAGGHLLLSGNSSLPGRKLDLRAVIMPVASDDDPVKPDVTGSGVPAADARQDRNISIKGSWEHPLLTPAAP